MKNFISIILIFFTNIAYSQIFPIETILQSGSNESRINLVILSDGYKTNELDQFLIDATRFSDSLFTETPYKEYKNYFNVHAIKVPSNESGANHPGTATDVTEPSHPVLIVDNYFESTFDAYDIERLLVVNYSIVNTVLANNFPNYDIALVLVNSPFYGGSGGAIAVSSTHEDANQIAIHELGHSFGDLSDEYYAGDSYAAESANMTEETESDNIVWKNWINQNGIDIYQHCCGGNSANWYKPHLDCKMQTLGSDFCSVCIEQIIEKIHSITSPILAFTPDNTGVIDVENTIDFDISLIETIPNVINAEWKLNNTIIDNNVNTLSLSQIDLLDESNQLQVTITDQTSLLKIDNHEMEHFETIIWDINKTTSIIDIEKIYKNSISIQIYPNPSQKFLSIYLENELRENCIITLFDLQGKKISSYKLDSSEDILKFDISKIPSGIYIVNFKFENGLLINKQIQKE